MKYSTLGALLKASRTAVGYDQQELARRMDVRQQAVSGWERGLSRPRQSQLAILCSLLDLDVDVLTRAGEYEAEVPYSKTRLLSLPFENLADEAFEAFCRDLLSFKFPDRVVSRNGSTGEKQFGIDVYVDGGGERIGVQCKRHKIFGPADIRAAVKEVMPRAGITSGVIALSRQTATVAGREELKRFDSWTLWDGEDLSRLVRELPLERALTLVDTYFEGLREEFLGVPEPSPWLSSGEYDTALPGRLGMDRDFELVGRSAELEQLTKLAYDNEQLILLVGRGGIGKTRLLREFANTDLGRPVRFASRGALAARTFELLPAGAPIVVIDDAADSQYDIPSLVGGIWRTRPEATIVLSARPRSVGVLRASLELTESDTESVTVELNDLTLSDAESLAREALGDRASNARAESLARIGYDCPFLIVVGAHLVRSNKVSDQDLSSQGVLRREILTRFADTVVRGSDADARMAVLAAVAALQPAPLDEAEFRDAISALSQQGPDRFLGTLDELEDLGLILRRRHTVRVVPDLLGDAVLERALVSDTGIDKGFAQRVADHAAGRELTHAIRNVSMIDWHRRSQGSSELAHVLWSALNERAVSLGNSARIALVKRVAPVAGIFPRDALELVNTILDHPASDEADPFSGVWGETRYITHVDVERALAPLINNAGYNPEQLEQSMRLLFRIGLDDLRAENQYPEHALRLLRELGQYHPRRPVSFYEAYVAAVGLMLNDSALSTERSALVQLLKGVLEDDVTVTESKGLSLQFSRLSINYEAVEAVRFSAISIATDCLESDIRTAEMAMAVLRDALQPSERPDVLSAEFVQVANAMRRVIIDPDRPSRLRLAAYRALAWQANYGTGDRRARAREIRREIARDDALVVTRAVTSGWDVDEDADDDLEDDLGDRAVSRFYRSRTMATQETEDLVRRWVSEGRGAQLLELIERVLREELSVKGQFNPPSHLLMTLFKATPDLAAELVSRGSGEDSVTGAIWQLAFVTVLEFEHPTAEHAAVVAIAAGESRASLVAGAVIGGSGQLNLMQKRVVRLLLDSDVEEVHAQLLTAARWLEENDRELMLEILDAAPIESSSVVADAAARILTYGRVVAWATLSPSERQGLLDRFLDSPNQGPSDLGSLLNEEIKIEPENALAFLQHRVDQGDTRESQLRSLPHVESMHLEWQGCTQLADLIDQTVEWMLAGESWGRRFFGLQILTPMLGEYGIEAMSLIRRLVQSREEPRVKLANRILDDAPHNFVLREKDFVLDLIELSAQLSSAMRKLVIAGLHGSADFGMRSRSVGVDDPADIALRDEAAAFARLLPLDSLGSSFYADVSERASRRLAADRADDRSLEDTRSW